MKAQALAVAKAADKDVVDVIITSSQWDVKMKGAVPVNRNIYGYYIYKDEQGLQCCSRMWTEDYIFSPFSLMLWKKTVNFAARKQRYASSVFATFAMIMKKAAIWIALVLLIMLASVVGGSCYMLDYALAPDAARKDTAKCFRRLFDRYPETKPWMDSLQCIHALRDTFISMPTRHDEHHHAYYIDNRANKTALVLHGWRNCAIDMLFLARIYDRYLGYNVVIPDFHAHGLSDGEAAGMGWLDRKDMLHWMQVFQTDTMVVHGISMGAATTMMMAGEDAPEGISDIRFVEDCGYTSVWDEFAGQLQEQFGLPVFPLMYTTSMLCQWRYGWNFRQASSLRQLSRARAPMLFIHGDADTFVPTAMVHPLYESKPGPKELWIASDAIHAFSYKTHKAEYIERITRFVRRSY